MSPSKTVREPQEVHLQVGPLGIRVICSTEDEDAVVPKSESNCPGKTVPELTFTWTDHHLHLD